jgi:hypothetical protein
MARRTFCDGRRNPVHRLRRAGARRRGLIAEHLGTPTPRLDRNLPAAAADFARYAAPVLYKAFRGGPVHHDDRTVLTYATPVTADQIDDSVRLAPITLQQRADKVRDVRITCVDGRAFGVYPTRAGVAPLDWRDDHEATTWERVDIPNIVHDRLRRLCDDLGLRFCAADFSVDHHGQRHHLDLNPVGQRAWATPCARRSSTRSPTP